MEQDIPAQLISQCRSGDRAAFAELVTKLMRPAYFQALSLLGNTEDALDISQEAFVSVWRNLHRYDSQQPFYPWFYTILRNLAFNAWRARRRRRETSGDALEDWLELRECSLSELPDSAIRSSELTRQVSAALSQLELADREIICLREIHDFAYKDIAQMLGIPAGTVMSRLFSARQKLRHLLEESAYEHL
ncbi:RNA polymerase sigma factor [Pseudohongiella spirulinae]|uniref:RNA polymerase sigma factor n=1 Tax=Pseudohongiella spirulinae TaxID=1249552 RepID=A0A0S2KAI9_9GAMM|nr:sigma-70 family RNA polymerase sigma factor [Pseudohongiella spirulinae]ALO44991.1 hypothetical protein PS2015_299 [Pseudohongiella spirulinae]